MDGNRILLWPNALTRLVAGATFRMLPAGFKTLKELPRTELTGYG